MTIMLQRMMMKWMINEKAMIKRKYLIYTCNRISIEIGKKILICLNNSE